MLFTEFQQLFHIMIKKHKLTENNIDILIFTETKIDSSFSSSQFMIKGFSVLFRFDRNRSGGGVIVYVWDNIPSKQVSKRKLPDNIEGVFIEVNLRKIKWLIFGTSLSQSASGVFL